MTLHSSQVVAADPRAQYSSSAHSSRGNDCSGSQLVIWGPAPHGVVNLISPWGKIL